MRYIKPELKPLISMLSMFVGDGSQAKPSESSEQKSVSHTAVFTDASDLPVATCTVDFETAAALGCSLSMIPPNGAKEMVKDGALSTVASENLYEIMNVFSSLFMNDKSEHLKLDIVRTDQCSSMLGEDSITTAYDIVIGKYGNGRLVFSSV